MRDVMHWLHRRAEDVLVLLIAAMFASFIIQIATRYVFNAPTEWTHEVILITWLWAVFWGCAFLLSDKDHVKFDVIYNLGGEPTRRMFALVSAVAIGAGLLASLPATWSFISFKGIRSSDILQIRLDVVFSVYLFFLVALVIHYALRAWRLARGDSMATLEREESL